tara:strand:+ start:212 stop:754 length:543 start_codon:yes stop_codon:yes gene_type:complete
MAAEITSTGIQFSDSTQVNSRGWMTPDNTAMFFFQSSAPTHWVKSTSHNDKMLRVVSGTGAESGGSITFSSFSSKTFSTPWSSNSPTGNRTLSINQIAVHSHSNMGTALSPFPQNPNGTFNGGDVNKGPGWSRSFNATGNNNGGGFHDHPFSASGSTPSLSLNINVQYIDILLCNFDIDA